MRTTIVYQIIINNHFRISYCDHWCMNCYYHNNYHCNCPNHYHYYKCLSNLESRKSGSPTTLQLINTLQWPFILFIFYLIEGNNNTESRSSQGSIENHTRGSHTRAPHAYTIQYMESNIYPNFIFFYYSFVLSYHQLLILNKIINVIQYQYNIIKHY